MRTLTLGAVLASLVCVAGARADDLPPFRIRHRIPHNSDLYCGIDSLYVGLCGSGVQTVSLRQLEADIPVGPEGVSIEALAAASRKNGIAATVVRTDLARISGWDNRMVLHVQGRHFITLTGTEEGRLIVFDNSVGLIDCTPEWFAEHYRWNGVALVLGPPPPSVALRKWGPGFAVVVAGLLALVWAIRKWRRSAPVAAGLRPDEPEDKS